MAEEKKKQNKIFLMVGILALVVIAFGAGMFVKGSPEKRAEREQEEALADMRKGLEATKVVNRLRNYKSAALMYYTDKNSWPKVGVDRHNDLDMYMDRSLDTKEFVTVKIIQLGTGDSARFLIGLEGAVGSLLTQPEVKEKLEKQAENSGLYTATGEPYTAKSGTEIYIDMPERKRGETEK